MKSNYKKLGEYIRQVDVRNIEGKEDNLLGVSVQKVFIPSIANTVGTDFTKYKVVKKGQFTYIPDTSRRGDKIPNGSRFKQTSLDCQRSHSRCHQRHSSAFSGNEI